MAKVSHGPLTRNELGWRAVGALAVVILVFVSACTSSSDITTTALETTSTAASDSETAPETTSTASSEATVVPERTTTTVSSDTTLPPGTTATDIAATTTTGAETTTTASAEETTTTEASGALPVLGTFAAWIGGGDPAPCDPDAFDLEPPYFGGQHGQVEALGSVAILCAIGFDAGAIDVSATFPDGSVGSFQAFPFSERDSDVLANPLGGDPLESRGEAFSWFLPSETPPGTYVFDAKQGDITAASSIEVRAGQRPALEPLDGTKIVPPGHSFLFALSGHPPNTPVPLAVYEQVAEHFSLDPDADIGVSREFCGDSCAVFELFEELGSVRIDGNGAARVELFLGDHYSANAYCVTNELVGPGACDEFGSGWFVVTG